MLFYTTMESPVDDILILGDGKTISRVFMDGQKYSPQLSPQLQDDWQRDDDCYRNAREQLEAYFAGDLTTFDLPLNPTGTDFQKQVWKALLQIPFGETVSYQAIANSINNPKAVRAVGAANGRNPIGIIVPCHRVIGANGSLTGYAGGLERKQWLLEHEQRQARLF